MKISIGQKNWEFGFISQAQQPATTLKKQDKAIIVSLAKEFTDRSRADIQKWRKALNAAANPENPRWSLYQDLVDNLMNDGHLKATIQVRKAATLSNRFIVRSKKTGKEVPEKTTLLHKAWFHKILASSFDAFLRGYTVLELIDPVSMEWAVIPRRNIAPQLGRVYFEVFGDKFAEYKSPAFKDHVIEFAPDDYFGLLNDVIPQLIWKRNAQQTWADFSERFGIPLITATTNKTDKQQLDRIETMLKALGQSAQAVLPEGTVITIHDQATKGDPYKVFQEQIKTANEEISKRLLGGTMLTDNGSSRSQSEVHERTLDYKISENDRMSIEFFVNDTVMTLLQAHGFAFTEDDEFIFDRSEDLTLKEHWSIVSDALNHYEIDQNWVGETFNIPIVKPREKQAQIQDTAQPKSLWQNFR